LFLILANKILTDNKYKRHVHLEITIFETITRTISACSDETLSLALFHRYSIFCSGAFSLLHPVVIGDWQMECPKWNSIKLRRSFMWNCHLIWDVLTGYTTDRSFRSFLLLGILDSFS